MKNPDYPGEHENDVKLVLVSEMARFVAKSSFLCWFVMDNHIREAYLVDTGATLSILSVGTRQDLRQQTAKYMLLMVH